VLVQHAPAGIYEVDLTHGRFLSVNDVMCEYTGYTREEFMSPSPLSLLVEEDQLRFLERRAKLVAGEAVPETVEYQIRVKDGRTLWVLLNASYTHRPDGVTAATVVIHDITERKRMEQERERLLARIQQQERLAAVGQLAAGIAHNFNNVMATIVLYAQMAARTEGLSEKMRERMLIINQQAQHTTRLIRQILDFSRRAVLERRPLDLKLLLQEQVKLLQRTLPETISVTLTCGPGEYAVHADLTSMQQMIMNLAVNARDAMPQGGRLDVHLARIRVAPHETRPLPDMAPGDWVQIGVTDTGAGISPENLSHLFEPFFTTKGPGQGSGLGLPQVYGIVGQHEGYIDVVSQVGEGTTFTIYLPALPVRSPQPQPRPMPDLPSGKGEMILVVEDDPAARHALSESLAALGYRVTEAINGQQALHALERHPGEVALILSDVVMPGMGGVALLHAVRERALAIPVVLLTGHPLEHELKDLRDQGMVEWLMKPIDLEQLAEVIARALQT